MKITIDIPEQTLRDLLCTAVEGGANYWAQFSNVVTTADGADYESVVVTEQEASGDKPIKVYCDLARLVLGLERLTQNPKGFHEGVALQHFTDALTDHDATTADVVLQMAVFGEVIYG